MNYSEKKLNTLHNSIMQDPALFEPAEFSATESEKTGVSNYSYWRSTLRTFFKSKSVIILCVVVALILLMSFFYSWGVGATLWFMICRFLIAVASLVSECRL